MVPRWKFSPEFKAHVVLELLTGERGLMQASWEYGIKDTVLSRWKQEFLERSATVFELPPDQSAGYEQRIAELERMVGKLTVELEVAKKPCDTPPPAPRETPGDRAPAAARLPRGAGVPGGEDVSQQLLLL
jgi:transposase-like protein